MDGETLIITEMVLSAVLCLGFGFYQLWSLNRDKKRAALEKQQAEQQARQTPAEAS